MSSFSRSEVTEFVPNSVTNPNPSGNPLESYHNETIKTNKNCNKNYAKIRMGIVGCIMKPRPRGKIQSKAEPPVPTPVPAAPFGRPRSTV